MACDRCNTGANIEKILNTISRNITLVECCTLWSIYFLCMHFQWWFWFCLFKLFRWCKSFTKKIVNGDSMVRCGSIILDIEYVPMYDEWMPMSNNKSFSLLILKQNSKWLLPTATLLWGIVLGTWYKLSYWF